MQSWSIYWWCRNSCSCNCMRLGTFSLWLQFMNLELAAQVFSLEWTSSAMTKSCRCVGRLHRSQDAVVQSNSRLDLSTVGPLMLRLHKVSYLSSIPLLSEETDYPKVSCPKFHLRESTIHDSEACCSLYMIICHCSSRHLPL